MNRTTLTTLQGTAAALLLAASTVGHAQLITFGDDQVDALYAKETVVDANAITEKAGYYSLPARHQIIYLTDLVGFVDDTVVVTVTLEGMVFSSVPSLENTVFAAFTRFEGGGPGDDSVSWVGKLDLDMPNADVGNVQGFAHFAIGPDGIGGVTLELQNETFVRGGFASDMATAPTFVQLMPALEETATPGEQVAEAVSDFKDFGPDPSDDDKPLLVVPIGELMIGFDGDLLSFASGTMVAALAEIEPNAPGGTDAALAAASVVIGGDFTFVDKLLLVPSEGTLTCAAADETGQDGFLQRNGDGEVTDTTASKPIAPGDFSATQTVCIVVKEDTVIPEAAYTATTMYTGVPDAVYPPSGDTHPLGMITRDGTTAHIPFLTTYEGYNNRITLVNRGTTDADYSMTFQPENGVTAVAKSAATDTLAAGQTLVLRAIDVVTLDSGARTAATITIAADPRVIDVATTVVNKSDGSVNTVVHTKN